MFFRLLFLFTVTPVVELFLLIRLGQAIGAWPTIAIVLVTGFLGAGLARLEGFAAIQRIRIQMERGAFPADAMIDGLCILVAGLFLITPGIITDVLGFLLLIPQSRSVLKRVIARYLRHAMAHGTVHFSSSIQGTTFSEDTDAARPAEGTHTTFIKPDSDHEERSE